MVGCSLTFPRRATRILQGMATALTAMGTVIGLCATFALALVTTHHHERRSADPGPPLHTRR
jgi:hypothetical protein